MCASCNAGAVVDRSASAEPSTKESPPERLAHEFAARHALDVDLGRQLTPLVQQLIHSTKYQCVRINAEFEAGCLKFYFIKQGVIGGTEGMCGYAGEDTVFCDAGFLTHYLDELDALRPEVPRDAQYSAFQTWVLGHEVGHADLGHTIGHFMTAPFPTVQKEAWHVQRLEFEADRRFLKLARDVPQLERVLVAIFDKTYLAKYGPPSDKAVGLALDRDPTLQFPYVLSSSHPHMTLRTAELLAVVAHDRGVRADAISFVRRSGALASLEEIFGKDGYSNDGAERR